ncbi:hypothetical protein D3C81_1710220 [compost metagenome]
MRTNDLRSLTPPKMAVNKKASANGNEKAEKAPSQTGPHPRSNRGRILSNSILPMVRNNTIKIVTMQMLKSSRTLRPNVSMPCSTTNTLSPLTNSIGTSIGVSGIASDVMNSP